MKFLKSQQRFARARRVLPGGVNSPVRAFGSVGMTPLFIDRAKGAHLWDIDGNKYIDYVGSWGPMILGHAHPRVLHALQKAAVKGTSFGAPTELEVKMAELISRMIPSMEMVRMVNSGTEATMSAIRLARAFTSREKIIKFEGCYHGHADSFLIKAGSGALTLGTPTSPGVPTAVAQDTLVARFNDIDSVEALMSQFKSQVAAVIVEPVVGNMGCVPPQSGFLEKLRAVCTREKAVFIMDEVMTGFRVHMGGAQALYKVRPDLTTLGKIIGGGLPVGAYGGSRDIMGLVAPSGPMYQAGTLSGNPLAMAAGNETLRILSSRPSLYHQLEQESAAMEIGLRDILKRLGLGYQINRVGSMFTLFFTDRPVIDYESATSSDTNRFALFFQEMLRQGIYLPPSQYETAFVSTAHTHAQIQKTLSAAKRALERVSRKRT